MPNLNLKKIPVRIYRALKRSAHLHHRSMNSEAIVCLEKTLTARLVDVENILERARAVRIHLDQDIRLKDLNGARKEGRPR